MYRRKDAYYRKAKARGLRSRAAFKLEDLAGTLLRPGDRVLDLGSWPGGWLQVAARAVGARGRVAGIDLKEPDGLGLQNVRFVCGDVADPQAVARLLGELEGPADVVLSDMAPKLSGIRDRDDARAEELARLALRIAVRTLRPGGGFLCKVFMGPGYPALLAEVKECFAEVSTRRSEATRKGSSELYVIARRFRGGAGTGVPRDPS